MPLWNMSCWFSSCLRSFLCFPDQLAWWINQMKRAQFACTRNWKDCLMAYEAMWFVSWCGDTEREFLLKKRGLGTQSCMWSAQWGIIWSRMWTSRIEMEGSLKSNEKGALVANKTTVWDTEGGFFNHLKSFYSINLLHFFFLREYGGIKRRWTLQQPESCSTTFWRICMWLQFSHNNGASGAISSLFACLCFSNPGFNSVAGIDYLLWFRWG